ncbi:tetratricopeptide repeat-containing sulfotransferase family protein [Luteimonas gilva]|uniref:tetratricopeptide repeat-containing sulfotransferase family protein n=1 Tax=Luteimonas gilva TaxID=2572684 RepID=UPI0016729855|nr:sulfotransferase [Luteimonas gilva]
MRAEPGRLYVRMRLSLLEQAFGHYRRSREHALAAADAVRSGRWSQIGSVTARLLAFDEGEALHGLIRAADWSSVEIARNSPLLAQQLYLTDRADMALDLIDAVFAKAADSEHLSYARANALRYTGRLDEATAEYERCLSLQPNYVHAHWALAYHQASDPPLSRIERIEKTQAALDPASPDQAYLHYALFKEYDAADDADSAWRHLMAGAQIKRRTLRYDSAAEQADFEAVMRSVDADFIHDPRSTLPNPDRVPIFVVGMPRTGTTLLERILGNQSRAAAGGELRDFNTALCLATDGFVPSSPTPAWLERLRAIDLAGVGDEYLRRTADRYAGGRYLIDKNPMNFAYAGHVAKALPQAKILCLRRNAMDACFSNLKELFTNAAYGYSYDQAELADHYARFSALCDHWQRAMPERFLTVDYEDLVSDPLSASDRIAGFCGLAFEPDSVDITRNRTAVATASSSQVRQPIHRRGVNAWRKYEAYLQPLQERLDRAASIGS